MISLRSKITQKVLNHFLLNEDGEGYINELSRALGVDSGNLTRKLIELEGEGILQSRWQGSQRYYSLNKKFPLIKEYRQIILKTVGFESILKNALINILGIKRAVIFGSYAANKMDSHSDIDLLVIGSHDNLALQRAVARVQKTMARDINVISMSPDEYDKRKKTDQLLKSIEAQKKVAVL